MAEIKQSWLRENFNYDPKTGSLTWRHRKVSLFASERQWRQWTQRYAGKEAGGVSFHGYRRIRIDNHEWKVHRLIWLYVHGQTPIEIDHVNGDRADNRLDNLRAVTRTENSRNLQRPKDNTSGIVGIGFAPRDKIWRAHIADRGHTIHLGNFKTKDEAVAARRAAEKVLGFHKNHGRDATHDDRRQT